ncbi:MAG: hypothetical protein A3H98_14395 [Bacteroidetes bacterium RIFCSPLOWO2_02_FULL_36_8]|nr:MAG: hypothetical protein A3H98_14395 [Bacteroidetes bacterium RIFCSPLOWO2_02_FULL_36_8]OFY71786.1 MAG: hypothetical protein A3G23_13795 [Bacteroidetes bacterium RIFCSPLOWO2_12_FULL_37_12]
MKLIIISNPKPVKNESIIINKFFEKGLKYFHLRKPEFNESEMVKWITAVPLEFHERIILHSHHHLLHKFDLKGVHFTSWFNSGSTIKSMYRRPVQYSTSYHSLEEINLNKISFDYVFLGPVYNSISKKESKSKKYNLNDLKETLLNSKADVVALGGISSDKIKEIKNLGFKGVAVLGGVWNSANPLTAFSKIQKTCTAFMN